MARPHEGAPHARAARLLVLGSYSVHTSREALARGEAGIEAARVNID